MKIGTDIVHIPRFEKLMQNEAFIKKVFHESEIKDYRAEHLAGVIAAEMKVPVVPIKLEKVYKVLPKGSFWPRFAKTEMKIGKPFIIKEDSYIKAVNKIEEAIKAL